MAKPVSAPLRKFRPLETNAVNTVYQAASDGHAILVVEADNAIIKGYADNANPPTTIRSATRDETGDGDGIIMPVIKGEYWKITCSTGTATVWWIPEK